MTSSSFGLGAFQVAGISAFNEANVVINGVVASCVESAELSIDALYGVLPLTSASDRSLIADLASRGQAAVTGATNWQAASDQLTRLGIPNTAYGPGSAAVQSLGATLLGALAQGIPVLLGTNNAQALVDVQSGQHFDAGVQGHAIDIVGYDPTRGAFIAVDPNSAPAWSGGFVEYTLANLQQAGADSLVIPNAPPTGVGGGVTPLSFTGAGGTGVANPLAVIGQLAGSIVPWANAGRLAKLVLGIGLVGFGLALALRPQLTQAAGLAAVAA